MSEVAQTIISQLGGQAKLKAMLGASSFSAGGNSVSFRVAANTRNKAKAIVIKLDANDTYQVEYFRMRGFECVSVGFVNGLHCDQLKPAMEHALGLALSF